MENINWEDLFGQENVKILLTKIIESGKIPHAFLFHGIEGCGKEFAAIKFAENLNIKYSDKEFFNIDQIRQLTEPYVKYVIPLPRGKNEDESHNALEKLTEDEIQTIQEEIKKKSDNPYHKITIPKANVIKVNSIRDIKIFLSLNFSDVKYRLIIISDAHLMNDTAQNSLLKSLEEPPEGIIFILTTSFPGQLRETIRSRCWDINFSPLSNSQIRSILIKYYGIEEELASQIATFSSGSVQNALKLYENDFEELIEKTISFLRYSFGHKFNSAYSYISPYLSEKKSESFKFLIQLSIIWFNDLQKYRVGNEDIYFTSQKETLAKFNAKFPNVELANIVTKLDNLHNTIDRNVNLNTIALNMILIVASLTT